MAAKEVGILGEEHCHSKPEEMSICLHRAIAAKLQHDPAATLAIAKDNIVNWRKIHKDTGVIYYLDRWQQMIEGRLEDLANFLVSPSQDARDMRQCSPFAGVLSNQERWAIIDDFSAEWNRRHPHETSLSI